MPHILLVEDDEDQRRGMAELLRREGFRVTEAADAESALERLHGDRVDLLVTDYQLGGATGTWLARIAARSLQPDAPAVLIVTGHTTVADDAGLKILRKPLDGGRFVAEVRQVLAARPAPMPELATPQQRIALMLYVNASLASQRTRKTVERVLAEYESAQVVLTTVDVSAATAFQAEQHRVVAAPTLIKAFPPPRVWIAGEFGTPDVLRRLLNDAGVERRS